MGTSIPARNSGNHTVGNVGPFAFWAVLLWLVLVCMWLTWIPFVFGPAGRLHLVPRRDVHDLIGNLTFLVPFGITLGTVRLNRPMLFAAAVGALLSLTLELGQLFLPARMTSLSDLVLNAAGAAVGAWLGVQLRGRWGARRVLGATFGITFLAIVAYTAAAGFVITQVVRLADWDADFEIASGDEVGGERKYLGEVSAGWICAGEGDQRVCAVAGADRAVRARLVEVAQQSQRVELHARVVSATHMQFGPTRIFTFSRGPYVRNITLGQEGDDLVLRLRTPMMGENGRSYEIWIPDAIQRDTPAELRVEYEPRNVRAEITTASGTRTEQLEFGLLSSGLFLRGDGPITPAEMHRLRIMDAVILLLPLALIAQALAAKLVFR